MCNGTGAAYVPVDVMCVGHASYALSVSGAADAPSAGCALFATIGRKIDTGVMRRVNGPRTPRRFAASCERL